VEHIGIIGSGVAGLGCAYGLRDLARVTILEKNDYAGGHTNTRTVEEDGASIPIDTGFIVFNHPTYPHLTKLFAELGVPTKRAEMSFAVRHDPDDLEYNGMGLNKVFAQRSNLLRPPFWKLLREILRFFRVARASLDDASTEPLTLREFCARHGFGREFVEWYLVPMGSAVWSTEPEDMLDFPAHSLLRFFHNHGFLGVTTHHPWFTVDGGARTYVEKIQECVGAFRLQTAVRQVKEGLGEVKVRTLSGEVLRFDRVIIATHADQALALLDGPDELQRELLAPFRYQKNHATLHTWPGFLPRRRRAWAAWNFLVEPGPGADSPTRATVHYWMNALQGVSRKKDYFVSLNSQHRIPDGHILYETMYEHPVFTLEAIRAQTRLPDLNRRSPRQRVFFCGSYFRHGFHEDAYGSAVDLVQTLRGILASAQPGA
jgi:predicted NAD/FAD-binding protein